ncbi:MAG: FCD domain-containing protein [Streptosporangiales bacterium]|nr:FCD domain-containing protein [Streptosporangiales bacterium]
MARRRRRRQADPVPGADDRERAVRAPPGAAVRDGRRRAGRARAQLGGADRRERHRDDRLRLHRRRPQRRLRHRDARRRRVRGPEGISGGHCPVRQRGPEQIAEAVRRAIRAGVLEPGQPLVQEDLAARFGVSRAPLREALRVLAGEGLVTIMPGYGAVVTSLDPDEITELYEIRVRLETMLADEIVARIRPHDVAEFADLARAMDGAVGDQETWSELNFRFHRRMYEIAEGPHALRIVTQLLSLVEPYSRAYVHGMNAYRRVQDEHHQMVDALRSGEGAVLAKLIEEHLRGAQRGLVASLAEGTREEDPLEVLRPGGRR